MIKCANCTSDAAFKVDYRSSDTAYYCAKCIPAHLRPSSFHGTSDFHQEIPKKKRKAEVEVEVEADDNSEVRD